MEKPRTKRFADHAGDGEPDAVRPDSDDESADTEEKATTQELTGDAESGGVDAPLPAAAPPVSDERGMLERAVTTERDKYLRLAAEFDNYRKRSSRDRQEAGWRAQSDLVLGLLEALDDLMRFAHLDPDATDAATVVQGALLVERKMLKTLSGHGLEVVNPVDHPFDPAFHEAVGTEPAMSPEDDHMVARVYQPGYVFRGQMLRPARVVVKQWLG